MFTETTIQLGKGLVAYPNDEIEIDENYQDMIDFLDNALEKLEEVMKKAQKQEIDARIEFDLRTLQNFIYTLYDKYKNLDYNQEAPESDNA